MGAADPALALLTATVHLHDLAGGEYLIVRHLSASGRPSPVECSSFKLRANGGERRRLVPTRMTGLLPSPLTDARM